MKGCGNHGCRVEEPKGIATNGRCRCQVGLIERDTVAGTCAQCGCIVIILMSEWEPGVDVLCEVCNTVIREEDL